MSIRAVPPCLALALASLLPAATALAQVTPSATGLAITVSALPNQALPGSRVVLSGQTGLVGSGSVVTLVVTPPGGKPPVTVKATPKPLGDYRADFTATQSLGTYQVVATAPDGKGTGKTSFSVVGAGVLPAEVGSAADGLVSAIVATEARIRTGLTAMPPSPGRTEGLARLAKLDGQVKQLPSQVSLLKQQVTKLFQDRAKVAAPVPVWDDFQAELGSWVGEAKQHTGALKPTPPDLAGARECGRIDDLVEDLSSLAEAVSVTQKPFAAIVSLGFEKLPAAGLAKGTQLSADQQFALTESAKAAAAILGGPAGMVRATAGFALDIGAFLAKEAFAQYCEKFEGPLAATFLGESFTTKGEPFFDYTIQLTGRLLLMYPKGASGPAIPMQGYLEGAGDFKVRDNPAPILRLAPGVVLFHKVTSPPGGGFIPEVGRPTSTLLPHTFRIPVTGTLAGDSIIIKMGPADHDFSEAIKGVSTYVIMPTGGLVPEVINSPISLQKAHPIIYRTINWNPVLRIKAQGKTMVAERSFARDTTNAEKTARVRTQLKLTACNPGCLTAPPAKKP